MPLYWDIGISDEAIQSGLADMIAPIAKIAAELWKDAFTNLDNDPDYYRSETNEIPRRYLGIGTQFVEIPRHVFEERLCRTDNRFSAKSHYLIAELNADSHKKLLLDLYSRVNFSCHRVEIRIEKGCFQANARGTDEWHVDDNVNRTAMACFTNKPNWRTHILEEEASKQVEKEFNLKFLNRLEIEGRQDVLERIESLSTTMKTGFFYDASRLLHRGPKLSDLSEKISDEEYRVFILFC
jgi:hypothetical protein